MAVAAPTPRPLHFTTRTIPERQRLSRWREEFGRGIVRVDFEPVTDAPFHAEAILYTLPGVRIGVLRGSAVRSIRTQALCADGDDAVGFIINARRRWIASQRGRDVALGPGDAVALLHAEPAVNVRSQGSHLTLVIPREALRARMPHFESATARPISRRAEALRLLVMYLRFVRRSLPLGTPELCDQLATSLHDLAALALAPRQAVGESGLHAVAAARREAALRRIRESFDDPTLNVSSIAQSLGISSRYLQRLLEMEGTSFTERVTELRLERIFASLTSGEDGRRICDIAYEAGFSDLSHFNRLFRSRFGDTPSGVRRSRRARSR
jgi:AraC-like DNA-binding protein